MHEIFLARLAQAKQIGPINGHWTPSNVAGLCHRVHDLSRCDFFSSTNYRCGPSREPWFYLPRYARLLACVANLRANPGRNSPEILFLCSPATVLSYAPRHGILGSEFGSTAGCSWSSLSEKKTKMIALKQNRPGLPALQAEVQLQMSWARPKQHRYFPNIRPKCGLAPEALRNSWPWQWKGFKGFVRIISHQT